MIRKLSLTAFLIVSVLYVYSCPVCRGGISKTEQDAYILTVIILGSLPLIIAGGLYFWVSGKYKTKK